jgi:hypothetical protein
LAFFETIRNQKLVEADEEIAQANLRRQYEFNNPADAVWKPGKRPVEPLTSGYSLHLARPRSRKNPFRQLRRASLNAKERATVSPPSPPNGHSQKPAESVMQANLVMTAAGKKSLQASIKRYAAG